MQVYLRCPQGHSMAQVQSAEMAARQPPSPVMALLILVISAEHARGDTSVHHDWADHLQYGAGTFAGNDITYSGGLATFQSTYGTAKGSHSVTGTRITCESDSAGQFVVLPPPIKSPQRRQCTWHHQCPICTSNVSAHMYCCLKTSRMVQTRWNDTPVFCIRCMGENLCYSLFDSSSMPGATSASVP